MKKLISMTDFVIHESFGVGNEIINKEIFYNKCSNYAQFLKQPLKLEMFVPCDDDGNAVESKKFTLDGHPIFDGGETYQKAKEKVLFEGFKKYFNSVLGPDGYLDISKLQGKTIEDIIGSNLQLTQSALKQIGL